MQTSKHDLVQIAAHLGLSLSHGLTTVELLAAITKEFHALHQALAWLVPSEQPEGLAAGCAVRLENLYALARKKKFKRVRPAKETP